MESQLSENDDITEQLFYDSLEETVTDKDFEYEQMTPLRDQDRFLPIANISKIMKKAIPSTGKIAKEAKETLQECVSEYISFITSEAAERCQQEKRKTINGEDIIFAMTSLGFDSYIEPLRIFLGKYRECTKMEGSSLTGGMGDEQVAAMPMTQVFLTVPNTNDPGGYTEVITTNHEDHQQLSALYAVADSSNGQQTVTLVNGDENHDLATSQ